MWAFGLPHYALQLVIYTASGHGLCLFISSLLHVLLAALHDLVTFAACTGAAIGEWHRLLAFAAKASATTGCVQIQVVLVALRWQHWVLGVCGSFMPFFARWHRWLLTGFQPRWVTMPDRSLQDVWHGLIAMCASCASTNGFAQLAAARAATRPAVVLPRRLEEFGSFQEVFGVCLTGSAAGPLIGGTWNL